jgi:amidohydrolase
MSLAEEWRDALGPELAGAAILRHALHSEPRVGGREADTARLLADAIGAGHGRIVAETGRIIPITPGSRADAPAVAIRTELDALPILEQTGVEWASNNGAMHACGHDIHMAALAAVARAGQRIDLPVPLIALLQPREEGSNSGARDIVSENGLDGIDAVVAAHVQPQLGSRIIAATPGPVNASTDEFTITVRGQGGHSGYPHTVDDSVLALSSIIVATQQISARRIDPVIGAACMVTGLQAGSAANVVPGDATAFGTLRTMRQVDQAKAQAALQDIVVHIAAAHGCTGEVTFRNSEPPLVNDPALAALALSTLLELGHVTSAEFRSFGSDDFSHYAAHARSLMMFVGTGLIGGGLHDARYLPGDEYIELVAEALIAGYCSAAATQPDSRSH